jgi:hypothetical protein
LFGFAEGAYNLSKIFKSEKECLTLGDQKFELTIDALRPGKHLFNVWDQNFSYKILNWMPFNSESYDQYRNSDNLIGRIEILQRILTGNIITLAKGIGWQVDKRIEININSILKDRVTSFKDIKLMEFDLKFSANVSLPYGIGLGKNSSTGHGIIIPQNLKTSN